MSVEEDEKKIKEDAEEDLSEKISKALKEEYEPVDLKEVTLDDVLNAIRVLERFMQLYKRASNAIIRFQGLGFNMRMNPRDVMSILMGSMFQPRGSVEPAPDDVRDVIDRIERKKKSGEE